jgi:hypothetical protein
MWVGGLLGAKGEAGTWGPPLPAGLGAKFLKGKYYKFLIAVGL